MRTMKLENRIFNGRQIRMVWSESEGKWYFSVVDVIEALTETERPRKYWSDLKSVLKSDDFELSEKVGKIGQLKLKSTDGKSYKTDVADYAQLMCILEHIASPNIVEFRSWIGAYNMSNSHETGIVDLQQCVYNKIVIVRGVGVIIDADVAELYGVDTKRVNEAVKNNPDKFPEDYMFALTPDENNHLRSKFSTANISPKSRSVPKVFTEKGLYMLATILKSSLATEVTFAIIETFTKVRYLKKEMVELHKISDPKKQSEKMQRFGEVISDIVMPDLETTETESSLELNFFIGKIKHTVKRVKRK